MPSIITGGYAPPGVYTQTFFGAPPAVPNVPPLVPLFIGTGSEILVQTNLPIVRGSSSSVDQQIVNEDETGRAVTYVAPSGAITLGAFDGTFNRFQVRNYPLVNGDGSGTTATDTSSLVVTINGDATVVLGIDGANGLVEISDYPAATDIVLCTYYFKRTDTQVTDDVSAQVTTTDAIINGVVGQSYTFVTGATDTFKLAVDGLAQVTVTFPAGTFTAAVVAATLNGTTGIGTLVSSTFVDNLGQTCVRLTADKSIVIGDGMANGVLGFVANDATSRNTVFYVFNGPIVNGDNGGVTTTNPTDLTVLVDNVAVTASAVNGRTRAVTLPYAPAAGSTVTIEYYFNSWQDTFDYLANTGVTEITRAAITPNSNGAGLYIQGSDYVLKNDTVVWGTAVIVSSGLHTQGYTTFGTSQVTASLVDNQAYMAECSRVTTTTGSVLTASKTQFQLPFQPTTGNGRNSPLGATDYSLIANGRMDLPTDQPDLVVAYWGFGVSDAQERGAVTVTKVDSDTSTITLASEVPEGATVYATFYYNTLTDQAFIGSSRGFTATVVSPGTSGIGTYSILDGSNLPVYGVTFLGKGSSLTGITVEFPSGSEFLSDARLENGTPTLETVRLQFASMDETPAHYTFPSAGDYYTVGGQSSNFRVTIDGVANFTGGVSGIALQYPTGSTRQGAFASILGDQVQYLAASGETTYDITAGVDDTVSLIVDGVSMTATATAGAGVTLANFVSAINAESIAAGNKPYYTSAGSFSSGYTVALATGDTLGIHYSGATSGASGAQSITLTAGTYLTATTLAAEINTQLTKINGAGGLLGTVTCAATADSKLRFTLALNGADAAGFLEFINAATHGRSTGSTVMGTINITPADTLTVTVDGAPFVTTFNATPATITGAGATWAVLGGAPTLTLAIDLAAVLSTFAGTEASAANYVTTLNTNPLNAAFQAVALASDVGGQLCVTTLHQGSTATATITGGSAGLLAAIGYAGGETVVAGTGNVANIDAVTGSNVVTLVGVAIGGAGTAALNALNQFYVQSASTGVGSTVQFTAGAVATALGLTATAYAGVAANSVAHFTVPAGIDTAAATLGTQTKLYSGPIAWRYTVTAASTRLPYDRMILRNRIFPGAGSLSAHSALAQTEIRSQGGNGATLAGFPVGMYGEAEWGGGVMGPSLLGTVGWASGQSGSQPAVIFYDGSGTEVANNVLKFTANSTLVTVLFTGSGTGTTTALGPASSGTSVIGVINTAITAAGLTGISAVQEGAAIRLYATGTTYLSSSAQLIMGDGSATTVLGFTPGDVASATGITARKFASALMNHNSDATFAAWMYSPSTVAAGYFGAKAMAGVLTDLTGSVYVTLQSRTLGAASSFLFTSATTQDAYRTGTGLGITTGDGSSGEAVINGFFVTSSDPASGSGSADTSILNPALTGVGQDGVVGQTYVDDVTGLTLTVLPRAGGLAYPTGSNATLTFRVSSTLVTDSNIPTLAVNGLELTVANTANCVAGDTALIETFKRGGSEPAIGEIYYVSYNYLKTDFTSKLFSRLTDVVNEYGVVSPDNPLSLAAYLAFLNGSSVIGCQQVLKTAGSATASATAYMAAVDASAGDSLPGFIAPAVLVLLTPATQELARYVAIHCDVQSSIRYKAERTSIFGFAAGTRTDVALGIAAVAGDTRVRFVYPDIASLSLTDELGATKTYLVDGRYLAASVAASTTSPVIDPATPWESRQLTGFTSLNRRLDAVTMNQLAVGGVTVLENRPPFIRIRHGLTSDMSNILTKTPTVIQIADEVQKRIRATCEPFIGAKFLPQILGQIEGRIIEVFKGCVQEQIITSFTGVSVATDPTDPTAIIVNAYYQPVFPLLFIQVTLRVSSS